MIITEKFVWIHLPKCAGNKTRMVLQQALWDRILYQSPIGKEHESSLPKGFVLGDKEIVMNLRKIPSFLISKSNHHFTANRYGIPFSEQELLDLVKQGKTIQPPKRIMTADLVLNGFTKILNSGNKVTYIRQEFYQQDMQEFLSRFKARPADLKSKHSLRRPNSLLSEDNLSEEDIKKIYETNPNWSKLEKKIYNG